jgi:hypothetical protein
MYLAKWEGLRTSLTPGDSTGQPFCLPTYPIKTVQALGTFGGATVTIQGSNTSPSDGLSATWAILNNLSGTSIIFSSADIKAIQENTYWIRPYITGGDGTTDIDVYVLCVTER